ncbi:stalk domain-containing protein [Paenibacillus flagellatus]|uniref:Copper amine oxidase n=1 Tax=Paenibacillus flagellatus TaxID=2211139 RepID=A0A2V5KLF7_9BACL|nr:stalk domain-containing protein [Paenibacillus flagellatus]PYI51637.1 copper amine oxidase [Paenibacillus flagellatus]
MKKKFKVNRTMIAASLALALAVPGTAAYAADAASTVPPAAEANVSVPATALVPLRDFSESIGAFVQWNEADRSVIVLRGDVELVLKIGDASYTLNGKPMTLDKPVELAGEKTVVTLGVLTEVFGVKAGWNAQTGTVIVAKDDYPLLASSFIAALNAGKFAEASAYLNDSVRKLVPEPLLRQYWGSIAQTFGPMGPQVAASESSNAVHRNATLVYDTNAAPFEMTVRFDTYGRIDDWFVPASPTMGGYAKPAYDDASKYTEKEVTIGEGPLALPGTLTVPAGKGPFPAVVLVHGSGPHDRDESIGAVKPFRDLAVGLAAQGIAVLRYEKVTREHSLKSQLSGAPFTVNEETVDDAIRAVELLKRTEGIDASGIYVAGHSQAGMLIPRIVEAGRDLGIAGTIVLAGPSRPLEDLLLEQLKHQLELAKKAGQPAEPLEQQLAFYEQQIKLLKDPQVTVDNPPAGFMLGNAAWWVDFRNTYAGEQAKDQKGRMLIVQGENDVQVFPDNLDGWKKSLSARTDVAYKLYPKMNHTLVEFDGESTGAEYAIPANVPDYLIGDIAKWIKP